MDKPTRIITEHRRKRLTLWALAVLGWLAGLLFGDRHVSVRQFNQRFHHVWLDELTRMAMALLMVRALDLAKVRVRRLKHYWRRGESLRRAHFIRSLLGARLRRLLKHKDLRERIVQLTALLRDLDTYASHLAQRLRKLRRLWREWAPIAPIATLCAARAPDPVFADSS